MPKVFIIFVFHMNKTTISFFENKTYIVLALILPALFLYFKSLKFDFTPMDEQ